MSELKLVPEVVSIYETNFHDIPAMLRKLADEIEAGEYGEVNEAACAIFADRVEVFGWGPTRDGASAALLLQAGAHILIGEVAKIGR